MKTNLHNRNKRIRDLKRLNISGIELSNYFKISQAQISKICKSLKNEKKPQKIIITFNGIEKTLLSSY